MIDYEHPDTLKAFSQKRTANIIIVIVGAMSLAVWGSLCVAAVHELRQVALDSQMRGEAYFQEFSQRRSGAEQIAVEGGILAGLVTIPLTVSAIDRESSRFASILLSIYYIFQPLVSIIITISAMAWIYRSPAGMLWFVGAILLFIGCSCPIAIWYILRWGKAGIDTDLD